MVEQAFMLLSLTDIVSLSVQTCFPVKARIANGVIEPTYAITWLFAQSPAFQSLSHFLRYCIM